MLSKMSFFATPSEGLSVHAWPFRRGTMNKVNIFRFILRQNGLHLDIIRSGIRDRSPADNVGILTDRLLKDIFGICLTSLEK